MVVVGNPPKIEGTLPAINEATFASTCSIVVLWRPSGAELGTKTSITGEAALEASTELQARVDLRGVSSMLLRGALTLQQVAVPRGLMEPTFLKIASNPESTAVNKTVRKQNTKI